MSMYPVVWGIAAQRVVILGGRVWLLTLVVRFLDLDEEVVVAARVVRDEV